MLIFDQFKSLIAFIINKTFFQGVYSKLKDSSVSWSEKLSLARCAWDSPDCVIPNKQQVLLDWIVQELINGSKKAAQ